MRAISPILLDANKEKYKSKYIINYAHINQIDVSDCLIIDDNKMILQECKQNGIITLYPQKVICM